VFNSSKREVFLIIPSGHPYRSEPDFYGPLREECP